MRRVLPHSYFEQPTLVVARNLLGKFLVRRIEGNPSTGLRAREVALMITEVEAYGGPSDLASHARHGKTARNAPMHGPAGTIYVYFTYGMHWLVNISCGKAGDPRAVLIRGVAGYDGPAKLTKFLQIDGTLSGKMLGKRSGLWVEDRGVVVKKSQIQKGPRVGVDYAGPYKVKPWRFLLSGDPEQR